MDLWQAIAKLVVDIHPDRLESFANALSLMEPVGRLSEAVGLLGPKENALSVRALEAAWVHAPEVTPIEVAAAIRAGLRVRADLQEAQSLELVWTGPSTGLIPTRHTEQVMLEVIRSARSELIWITYVFHKADAVVGAIKDATAKGVDVRILIDAQAQPHAPHRLAEAVPGASIFKWATSPMNAGAVHAKCAVADSAVAFITSANLTSAALEKNMELGILIRGGAIPPLIRAHFDALIVIDQVKMWGL